MYGRTKNKLPWLAPELLGSDSKPTLAAVSTLILLQQLQQQQNSFAAATSVLTQCIGH